jgi:type IV pilus modification protein PilV
VKRCHAFSLFNQSGFSILEGLIAIAIFGVGLLSVITMLDVGFNAGTISKNRTTATQLAATMIDRIRCESTAQNDPLSKDQTLLMSYDHMDTSAAAPAALPASLAFAEWQQDIQQNLPNGRGSVVINPIAAMPLHRVVEVTVSWSTAGFQRRVQLQTQVALPI